MLIPSLNFITRTGTTVTQGDSSSRQPKPNNKKWGRSGFGVSGLMDLANLSSCKENYEDIQEKGNQKISASDQVLDIKSDYSFTVDREPISHHANKDLTLSSRIKVIERSLSRKGSQVLRVEKKMSSNFLMNDGDSITTPKASLMSCTSTMPEKLMLVNQNTDQNPDPQVHYQLITIMTGGNNCTTKPTGTPTKSSLFGKRSSSFKQSSIINPRRILFFFATLSSIGTIISY